MKQNKQKFEEVKAAAPESKSIIGHVRDTLGLVAAASGILIAVLWISGRIFAGAFFGQLGIPLYQVTFPIWEYAEIAWLPLLLYVLAMTAGVSLVAAFASWVLAGAFAKLDEWLFKQKKQSKPINENIEYYRQQAKFFLGVAVFVVWLASFSPLVYFADQWMRIVGESSGRARVLESALQVEILAANPLDLGDATVRPAISNTGASELYVYTDLKLLIYNNGKYYLFRDIDPATCKPLQVYIVDEKQIAQANLAPAVSLASQCNVANVQSTVSPPTSVPVTP